MNFNLSFKKIILIAAGFSIIMIVFLTLYFFEKTNFKQFGNILSYWSSNAHTGLVNTPTQLAYEENLQKKYAESQESVKVAQQAEENKKVGVAERPSQLFDISFELDKTSFLKANDLTARVIFTSFGTVSTPVKMTFDILDNSGNVVYSKIDYTTVETEAVYNKKFSELALISGMYNLRLTTLYNENVSDEFIQPFNIAAAPVKFKSSYVIAGLISLFFVFTLSVNVVKYIKQRREYKKQYGKI
jgi:hypothetical protein